MLKRIHEGHIGIKKCKARARDVMYWPRINVEIEDFISKCSVCLQHSNRHQKEQIILHDIPSSARDKVGTDLFHRLGQDQWRRNRGAGGLEPPQKFFKEGLSPPPKKTHPA